jgi:hypothetical protein
MSNVKCFTFRTHQTVIGEVTDDDGISFTLKNPMQVIPVPPRAANDSGGIGFAPYLAFVEEFDKGINFKYDDILTVNTPVDDLLAQYTRMFSRIEIAPAGLKI